MIGKRLYDLREAAGLTQAELGKLLSINKHSISSYERQKSEPNDTMKVTIAKFFNVSIDYLLGVVDEPTPIGDKFDDTIIRIPGKLPEVARAEARHFLDYLDYAYNKEKIYD